jgi:hypothetical protein
MGPRSSRGIPPLGDGDGEGSPPAGMETGKNPHPMGKRGRGWGNIPHPVPRGDPLNLYMVMFSCNI